MNNLVKQRITDWLMFLFGKETTLDPNDPMTNTVNLLYIWDNNLLAGHYHEISSYIETEIARIKNL